MCATDKSKPLVKSICKAVSKPWVPSYVLGWFYYYLNPNQVKGKFKTHFHHTPQTFYVFQDGTKEKFDLALTSPFQKGHPYKRHDHVSGYENYFARLTGTVSQRWQR